MPRVLITRPLASSQRLITALQRLGYEAINEPLLLLEPTHKSKPENITLDAIMITSGNALAMLEDRQGEIADFFDRPCFCVGPRTADKARAFGFRTVQNASGGGAELAGCLGKAFASRAASILHIAGHDADGSARRELERLGHSVIDWVVYKARPASAFTPATHGLLESRKLDAVLVFSPRTARVLASLLEEAALEACCGRLAAICLSQAVAKVLKPLHWRHLVAAAKLTEDAVLVCLQELCPMLP